MEKYKKNYYLHQNR